jgi:hypothetical protein
MMEIIEEKEGERTNEKKTDVESGRKLENNNKKNNLEWRSLKWKRLEGKKKLERDLRLRYEKARKTQQCRDR